MQSVIYSLSMGFLVLFTACTAPRESGSASRQRGAFELRLVDDQPSANSKPMTVYQGAKSAGTPEVLHVQNTVLLDETGLSSATLQKGNSGRPEIAISMTAEGRKRFADVTQKNIGKRLAIMIDGELYSAPKIMTSIPGGKAIISGNFSEQEARELAAKLNGALK